MTKLLVGLLGAAAIGTGGYAAASGLDADPARTVSLQVATTADTTTDGTTTEGTTTLDTTTQGTTTQETTTSAATTTVEDEAADISGPCDEAEHANDPRCTDGADDDGGDDDDRSGRRGGDVETDDDNDDDDRSGSNSGPG